MKSSLQTMGGKSVSVSFANRFTLHSDLISFHTEEVDFVLSDEKEIINWLQQVIHLEGKECGAISGIFCSDQYLLKINQEYLQHDTFTDIVTFNYNEGKIISGDLFISIDRVKDNAEQFNISFENELHRVLVHGVLHLLGYNDKTEEEARTIRSKEDFYLTLLSKI